MLTQGQAGRLRTRGPRLAADDGVRHRSRWATANPDCESRLRGAQSWDSHEVFLTVSKASRAESSLFYILKSRLLADARTSRTLANPRTSAGGRRWSPSPESLCDCESRLRIPTARSAGVGILTKCSQQSEERKVGILTKCSRPSEERKVGILTKCSQ